jgi:hypothetical protein
LLNRWGLELWEEVVHFFVIIRVNVGIIGSIDRRGNISWGIYIRRRILIIINYMAIEFTLVWLDNSTAEVSCSTRHHDSDIMIVDSNDFKRASPVVFLSLNEDLIIR